MVAKKATGNYKAFLQEAFASELSPIAFLQDQVSNGTPKELRSLTEKSHELEILVIQKIKSANFNEQKIFSTHVLGLMATHFKTENQRRTDKSGHGLGSGLSLYRTFDGLDEIFGLNYGADKNMKITSQERLYEGAGIGVQSSYSTLLNTLREINPTPGARFVDLGSGYGRAGLVVGLLRPDIDFIGYEYVPHRVEIVSGTVKNLSMQSHVHFFTQDLAASDFQIPEADIYYMYDPFTEETYNYVLRQLQKIAQHHAVTIVTKGITHHWMREFSSRAGWGPVQNLDGMNLCLYRSGLSALNKV